MESEHSASNNLGVVSVVVVVVEAQQRMKYFCPVGIHPTNSVQKSGNDDDNHDHDDDDNGINNSSGSPSGPSIVTL
jgi:hypothetical protein